MVEMALSITLFVFLLLGLVEAGRYAFLLGSLANAAREGARYAVVHPYAATSEIIDRVRQSVAGMNRDQLTISVPNPPRLPGTYVTVAVSYPFRSVLGPVLSGTVWGISTMRVP